MKEELITDVWTVLVEYIPEKQRRNAAIDYINTLQDHGVRDNVLDGAIGVDSHLDFAIKDAIDYDDDEDDDY